MHIRWTTLPLLAVCFTLVGCQTGEHRRGHADREHVTMHLPTKAIAVLTPTAGNSVTGTVTFEKVRDRMVIVADVSGLEPNSTHAWHIHQWGNISSSDGTATGGHYNPEGHDHALPDTMPRHAGDLGNLTADASGHAHAELTVYNLTINGKVNPVAGRAIIVHAGADDGGQPTGNAGARIAQGVIGLTN